MKNYYVYGQKVIEQVPRILGLIDRSRNSASFGCGDRYYWHYKLVDFPNARFQEVCLLLAALYSWSLEGNRYFGRTPVREWSIAAIDFWAARRDSDGSVSELYPHEHSFCATAFSAWAISEALIVLKREPNFDIEKTGRWLAKRDNLMATNQMAASAVALQNIGKITQEERFLTSAEQKIDHLLGLQDPSGWWPEYGGCDIGYLTITMGALAHYWKKTREPEVWAALQRASRFLEERVDSEGRYDYLSSTRQTQFIYPYGLMIVGSSVIDRHVNGLLSDCVVSPAWMDDRYLTPLAIDYLMAFREGEGC